jgi:hypothetical protein
MANYGMGIRAGCRAQFRRFDWVLKFRDVASIKIMIIIVPV